MQRLRPVLAQDMGNPPQRANGLAPEVDRSQRPEFREPAEYGPVAAWVPLSWSKLRATQTAQARCMRAGRGAAETLLLSKGDSTYRAGSHTE
jgi:hypothetical protein